MRTDVINLALITEFALSRAVVGAITGHLDVPECLETGHEGGAAMIIAVIINAS